MDFQKISSTSVALQKGSFSMGFLDLEICVMLYLGLGTRIPTAILLMIPAVLSLIGTAIGKWHWMWPWVLLNVCVVAIGVVLYTFVFFCGLSLIEGKFLEMTGVSIWSGGILIYAMAAAPVAVYRMYLVWCFLQVLREENEFPKMDHLKSY